MSLKKYLLSSVAACGALLAVAPAQAQSSATLNGQIQALQEQVRALNQKLQNLQSQVVQTQRNAAVTSAPVADIKAAPAVAAAPSGIVVSMPNGRPTIATADGRNSIALTGRIHWDVGDYIHYSPRTHLGGTGTPTNLNGGENFRRARLGVVGKVLGDWNYALIYDFGGTTDSGAGGINASGIEMAELSYTGFRPFVIEGGAQDVPYTLDEATSSNDIMFIERASAQVVAANIAAGDFRENFGGHWNNDRIWLGAYFTGPTTGTARTGIASQVGAIQRATFQVLQSDQASLHIGADAEELIKPPLSAAGGFRTLGSLSDRPELRIDPTMLIGTGAWGSAAHPVTGANVLGFEAAAGFGPAFAQAEYFHTNVSRAGFSDANFDGGYIEASYTLTGEHRRYNPATGAYSGISPAHPFDLAHFSEGAWGAVEFGARYSIIELNDNLTGGTASAASSTAIAGGKQQVFTLGANWYVNNNIRFMLDYLHGKIDKPESTAGIAGVPPGTNIGATFDAIALRTQVAW
jgi:phosphate-selective porin OprO and OprP